VGVEMNEKSTSNCAENDPRALQRRVAQLESKSVDLNAELTACWTVGSSLCSLRLSERIP